MKLYLKYFSIHVRSQMQYKISFFLTALGQLIVSFSAFLSIYFMFARFSTVSEFSYSEVLICFAVTLSAFSIAECFFRGFDAFGSTISQGEFDRIMVRPRNEIFQVLCSKLELTRIGRLLQAFLVLAYAIPASGIVWSTEKVLAVVLMILGGVFLFSSLFLVYAAFCFFTIQGLEFMNLFTDGGREMGKYPLAIYGKNVLKFYTYIIPMACVQYYPLLYLLGRTSDPRYLLTPLAALVFVVPCYGFWRFGVRHYKSTGS